MRGRLPLLLVISGSLWAAPHAPSIFRQPLRFEQNLGQASAEYRFLARGAGYALGLTRTGNDLYLGESLVRTRLVGAGAHTSPQPLERMPVSSNYFVGDRSQWRSNVPNFERVRYASVYPGIDLVFYGRENTLEYDFILQPGADPSRVQFDVTGADARVDPSGDLVIASGTKEVRWKRPVLYQTSGNESRTVDGAFVVRGHRVSFRVGAYDRSLPLVIDPTLVFSTYLGGPGGDAIRGTAVDGSGNVYVSGSSLSTNLSTKGVAEPNYRGAGTYTLIPIGDAFVAKYNSSGALQYFTYLGGSAEDAAAAIAVDSQGNAYITGFSDSPNFPVTTNAAQAQFSGYGGNQIFAVGDAFVAKFNPNGTQLLYCTFLGGSQDDSGTGIAIDSSGNAYVTGVTMSPNFPVTSGAFQTKYGGAGGQSTGLGVPVLDTGDGFVAKISPDGSKILFATYLGGTWDDSPMAIALDSSSNIYVAGATLSSNFPTLNAMQPKYGGADVNQNQFFNLGDGFLTKMDPTGSRLLYSTYFGGTGDEGISGITLDTAGNLYFTGSSTTRNLPVTSSAFQKAFDGPFIIPITYWTTEGDAFVGKLNSSGQLSFLTYLGGESDDVGMAIALDPEGNIAVAGMTQSMHFPITPDAYQSVMAGSVKNIDDAPPGSASETQGGGGDVFLAVLDPGGANVLYGTYIGGLGQDGAMSLAVDSAGNFYIGGIAQSYDFPIAGSNAQKTFGGPESDGVLVKFSGMGAVIQAVTNSASNLPGTAPGLAVPGMLFKGYGSQIGPSNFVFGGVDDQGNRVKTAGGVTIYFDGIPAPIYYVSSGQVAGWVPYEVAGKTSTKVTVQYNGKTTPPLTVPVASADPGLYSLDFSGTGQVLAFNADGSVNSASSPAAANTTITVVGTGEGQITPAGVDGLTAPVNGPYPVFNAGTPTATIGNKPAQVVFSAPAPGQTEGFDQFNIVVPSGLTPGPQPIVITVGAFHSGPNLTLAVK